MANGMFKYQGVNAEGKKVEVEIRPLYDAADSLRPVEYEVVWKIDGRPQAEVLPNG